MKTLSLKLSEPLLAKLTSAASERGESKSAIMREAIKTFVTRDNHVPNGSCLDLAKDLVGCVKGPVDLSFNKKHMHDYGR